MPPHLHGVRKTKEMPMQKIMLILFAAGLALSTALTAHAVTVKCTVESVTENKVLLDCGKKAAKMQSGDRVSVKTRSAADRKPLAGC